MKITKRQLQRIIKEEIEAIREIRAEGATEGVIDPKAGLIDSDKARSKARRIANKHFAKFSGQIQTLIWQLNDQWQPNAGKFKEDEVTGSDLFWQLIFNKLDRDHKPALERNTSDYEAMRAYVKEENI